MDPRFVAYQQARQALLNAQAAEPPDPQTVAAAGRVLRQTEVDVAAEFAVAWDANVAAIQAAKATAVEAIREQARVEVECGNAARARNPIHPVLNVDELTRVRAAQAAVAEARAAVAAAGAAFKAGVTVEQLEAVT